MEYVEAKHLTDKDLPPVSLVDMGQSRQEAPVPVYPENTVCPWSSQCADGWGLADHPLAMVYAPCQGFHALYDPETALQRGTLFSELDLPLEAVNHGGVTACGGCQRANRNRCQ